MKKSIKKTINADLANYSIIALMVLKGKWPAE